MHLLLTDILSCPRCGPDFGLVLLAHRVEARRVLEGELGCPNCRLTYPVEAGFADLRVPVGSGAGEVDEEEPLESGTPDDAVRLAALLGVVEGPGHVVVAGPEARLAPALASLIDGIEVVAVEQRLRGWPEAAGVSRIAAGPRLPLYSRSVRAVALSGADAGPLLQEAVRAVAPLGRVVVLDGAPQARDALEEAGLDAVLDVGDIIVAQRPASRGG